MYLSINLRKIIEDDRLESSSQGTIQSEDYDKFLLKV